MKKRNKRKVHDLDGLLSLLLGTMLVMPNNSLAKASPDQGPADTIWAMKFLDPTHLLAASSDSRLHLMAVTATSAQDIETLAFQPGEKVKELVISPDGQRFACLVNELTSSFESLENHSRVVSGSLHPLRLEASYKLPDSPFEAQSLLWLAPSAQSAQANGRLVVGTGTSRIGLKLEAGKLTPTFQVHSPRKGLVCFNDSTLFQGQGWTAWSPGCSKGFVPRPQKNLLIESWSLETGKELTRTRLDPSRILKYGSWSTVKLRPSPAGLFVGLGNRATDSLLFHPDAQGIWKGQVCKKTTTGAPSAMLADAKNLYIAFQWPGKIMMLGLDTLKWGPELRGVEDPMSLAIQGDFLYVGLRFGGIERYPLQGGKPVSLYLSSNIQKPAAPAKD